MTHYRKLLMFMFCLVPVGVPHAGAADEQTDIPQFFVAPIETEVQRNKISETASAYAVVNCNAFLVDSKFDPDAFETSSMESQLKHLAKADPTQLKLVLRYQYASEIDRPTRAAIKTQLKQLCLSAGFKSVSASEVDTSQNWVENYSKLSGLTNTGSKSESITRHRLINAYPLRTQLSRITIGDADCVIEIKQPFDGRQHDLSAELQTAVRDAVESIGLGAEKRKLLFQIQSTDAGRDLLQRLFDARRPPAIPSDLKEGPMLDFLQRQAEQYRPSPAMKLAIELGFDSISYTHSPGGGAPEKLVGKTAPNFKLKSPLGDEVELNRLLDGRPGLVTFWGVACGPCCQEAPHLTRLHKEYGSKFAIVAVNGYDETPEVVSKFVNQNKIDHPIVLGGGKLAEKEYFVGAYPTTYFVDRAGTVIDYKVGFDSAEDLEQQVRELIDEH